MNRNVFINCPFDNKFFPILKGILFTLVYLDFNPLISETDDSGASRLTKIQNYIRDANLSIHDLSRTESFEKPKRFWQKRKAVLPRMNMPFELGLDFGAKYYNTDEHGTKKFLILEAEKYLYQKVISDIAGRDTVAHQNSVELGIKAVRNWLNLNFPSEGIPRHVDIYATFADFLYENDPILREEGIDPNDVNDNQFSDIIGDMRIWIGELED